MDAGTGIETMPTTIELANPDSPDNTESRRRGTTLPIVTWLRLLRVYQKIDRRSAITMKAMGLSVSRFDVLNHAGVHEGRSQQELADSLLVTKGNITQLLDAMETDGLVCRQKIGRTNRVYLTDRGRSLRLASLSDHEARITSEFSVLTDDELETLVLLLRKVDRHLR
jgi:DNA-binding MarR family transcriptional regulator